MDVLPLLIGMLLLAFVTGSQSLSYLVYVLTGLIVFSRLWVQYASRSLTAHRSFTDRAFFGEKASVEVEIANRGWLPVPWLVIHESLPPALRAPSIERRVVSLAAHERTVLSYELNCQRRGYYRLGPLSLQTGDLLGLSPDWDGRQPDDMLIVYPKIIALPLLYLPSQMPFGDLATKTRFFEDPSRFFGIRDYHAGDTLRTVHWKSSAHISRLQVKRFEPAVALHAAVFLDLNSDSYSLRGRFAVEDLGCTIAASVAVRLLDLRQQVGLALSGLDELTGHAGLQRLPPAKGREQLMRFLEVLARARMGKTEPITELLPRASTDWGWGTSVVVITPSGDHQLVECCLLLRRRGFRLVVIATDNQDSFPDLNANLATIGVPSFWIGQEQDLDQWR